MVFTGIVEAKGVVRAVVPGESSTQVVLFCPEVEGNAHGSSIAVNGVCLTVTDAAGVSQGQFSVDVMGETLLRSTFASIAVGDVVNIERAMPAAARLDGHIVQGHVDAVGQVELVTPHDTWVTVRVQVPGALAAYIVEKGSVTLNGTSLTITAVSAPGALVTWLEVGLIPETLAATTWGAAVPGDQVNVEVDVLAKYVERIVAVRENPVTAQHQVVAAQEKRVS